MHLPLAFSIHHFVSSVGADAGFAAIVGLAILVLLYFAQARETSSLRDQSASASERVAELERRLALLGSTPIRPATPQDAPEPAAPQLLPGAPAGVAAPALAAATRVVALPKPPSPTFPRVAAAPAPANSAPASAAPAGVSLSAAGVTPAPATVAASGGGAPSVATPTPVPAAPSPSGTNGTGEHAVAQPSASATGSGSQPRRVQIRPGASFTPPPPPPLRPGGRRPAPRRWLPAVVVVVLAIVAVAALLIVTSSGGSSKPTAGARTTNAITPRPKAVFNPSSVTVAVLNGTDVFQLAHRVAVKLQRAGYKEGTVATATDQTHATTQVGYLSGHRHAASKVASALGLSTSAVAPADQSAQAVACPPPSACRADVIVTVGSDLSNTP